MPRGYRADHFRGETIAQEFIGPFFAALNYDVAYGELLLIAAAARPTARKTATLHTSPLIPMRGCCQPLKTRVIPITIVVSRSA
jgi:hypothetical protein